MMNIRKDQIPLILIASAIWVLAGLTAFIKTNLSAGQKWTITLVTEPRTVRININGAPYEKAQYVVTPIKLAIKPGKTKLKIIREGYKSHVTNLEKLETDKIMLKDINLAKKDDVEFVPIEVTGDKISKPYYVEIDRGLFQGETPLVANDLPSRGRHTLELFPNGPKTTPKILCTFFLVEQGSKSPLSLEKVKIKISQRSDGTYHFTGCQEE